MMRQNIFHKSERGQAIVLIAAAAIGLIAMIGLMVDGGVLLIEYGRLKRAIDAASLAAALQYREGYTEQQLTDASREFLQLNQSDVFDIHVDTDETDASLLTNPRRKMVRVTASRRVQFGFLRVIGITGTGITATSVGEAASVDIVIILDASAGMAYEGGGSPNAGDNALDDPSQCNPTNSCQPFRQVKDVAIQFVNQLYFPYDRVSIITFNRQAHPILTLTGQNEAGTTIINYETMTAGQIEAAIVAEINGLDIFQPAQICPTFPTLISSVSPITHCLNYTGPGSPPTYSGLEYPLYRYNLENGALDPSSVPSSNIGDALWLAGDIFGGGRQDSLWVTIVLAGGPANTGCIGHTCNSDVYPRRICPPSTWGSPFCRGADVSEVTRHIASNADYDADDYARDAADFLANPITGQGATVFSIGLGNLIQNNPSGDPFAGQKLLDYTATVAGDESNVLVNHGLYFYAPSPTDLAEIFRTIAENIATRISQ